ncbi:GNAT family N-acetyltransferase [Rhizobium johnstonii]|uniref:GNAT family N-acetyltransferase n=1 Tax=Rhizobium TaxID=379 RepID=UPI00140FF4CE|nr:GNAT family N-acetyltransferase [Rhizobium leguminosarum]QIO64069.1 GNAT family N-acetyltransferase [Rhizobium leguminosarum bv. trifolii]
MDLYAAAPKSVKRAFELKCMVLGETPVLAGPGIPTSEFNRAFMIGDAARPDLHGIVQWLDAQASPEFALQIAARGETADVKAWAIARGFAPSGTGLSKLTRDLSTRANERSTITHSLDVITDPDAALYGDIVIKSFGLPEATSAWFASLVRRPNWRVFVAFLDGVAVGSGAMFLKNGWAWFGIDGTLEVARGMGVQSTLIRHRIGTARMLGVRFLTAETVRPFETDGSHVSRDNYLRNGFVELYYRSNYQRLF